MGAGFEEVELLDAVDYGGPQRSSCGPGFLDVSGGVCVREEESNRSKRRDGFRRNLSAAGPPRLRNQTRCNHPFYRPAENRMCPDRAGAAPRGTIFVKDDRDRSDGRRAPVDLRPASVESGRVHHVRTSRDPPSRGRTDWTQLVLDARMRPLAGMTAHESASLAREAASHPDRSEGLCVRPVRRCSARSPRNRAL